MSIYGSTEIISQVIGFLLLPLYTRYLTPEDYGIFSMIAIISSGYAIIANLGISSSVFRFTGLTKDKGEQKLYLETAQIINLGSNVFFLILSLSFSVFLSKIFFDSSKYYNFILIAIFYGLISSLAQLPLSYFRVKREVKFIAYTSLINLGISVITTFGLIVFFNLGVWGAIIGGLSGNIVALIMLLGKSKIITTFYFNMSYIRLMLGYSIPIFPHKIISFIFPIFSQILLVKLLSLTDLGLYNIAFKFCLPLVFFVNIFQKSYSAYRYEVYHNEDKDGIYKTVNLVFISSIILIFTAISYFGGDLMKFLLDQRFVKAVEFIPILAIIPLLQGFYQIFSTGVEFGKSPKLLSIISGSGLVINIILSYTLISKFGIRGAALATSSGWLIMAILIYFYSQRLFKINYDWIKIFSIIFLSICFISINISLHFTMGLKVIFFCLFVLVSLTLTYNKAIFKKNIYLDTK